MTAMITDSPMTEPSSVEEGTPATEGRPVEPAGQPGRSATSRRVLGWTAAIAVIGVGTVLAATAFDPDPDAPGLNRGGDATQLDVHGIPSWWHDSPGLNNDNTEATQLDVHGIPTWCTTPGLQ